MERIIPLVIMGVFLYLFLFRRGGMGMGCCGGHGSLDSHPHHNTSRDKLPQEPQDDVIDLREGDYTILPSGKDKVS